MRPKPGLWPLVGEACASMMYPSRKRKKSNCGKRRSNGLGKAATRTFAPAARLARCSASALCRPAVGGRNATLDAPDQLKKRAPNANRCAMLPARTGQFMYQSQTKAIENWQKHGIAFLKSKVRPAQNNGPGLPGTIKPG